LALWLLTVCFLKNNTKDPHPLPPKASSSQLLSHALSQIQSIASSTAFENNCAKCIAGLEVAKFLALAEPAQGPNLAVELCLRFKISSTCEDTYSVLSLGSVITQVIANADVGGLDGQVQSELKV
jgi:sphingomyelin phosphodiesterase